MCNHYVCILYNIPPQSASCKVHQCVHISKWASWHRKNTTSASCRWWPTTSTNEAVDDWENTNSTSCRGSRSSWALVARSRMQQPIAGNTRASSGWGLCPCAGCNWLLHPAPTSAQDGLEPCNWESQLSLEQANCSRASPTSCLISWGPV